MVEVAVGVGVAVGFGVAVGSDVTVGVDSVGVDVPVAAAGGTSVDMAAGNATGR